MLRPCRSQHPQQLSAITSRCTQTVELIDKEGIPAALNRSSYQPLASPGASSGEGNGRALRSSTGRQTLKCQEIICLCLIKEGIHVLPVRKALNLQENVTRNMLHEHDPLAK